MSYSVCAVVVTFNRKNLLIECLKALQKQTRPIQGIYLIDNASTDGTPEILLEKGYITELPPKDLKEPWEKEFEIKNLTDEAPITLHYVRMHKNTGGAGGFYEGVKRGYEKSYDWLWLMDDDAEPKENALEKLSLHFSKNNVVALASLILLENGDIAQNHRGKFNFKKIFPTIQTSLDLANYKERVVEIDMSSFVGLIIRREAVQAVGYPKKEFFIYHDDVEYCIRLKSLGKILLVLDSVIIHKENVRYETKYFLNRESKRRIGNITLVNYYNIRNLVWLGKRYSQNKLIFYLNLTKYISRLILGILIYDDDKFRRIKLVLKGCIDGLQGNFKNEGI